ncbi:hypothetical protein PHLH3_18570 [Pseudomonas sp. St386]|nr:hypothetical protein PFLU4_42730 [Pseudomonas fluorescens]RDI06309.1 hypothetical protein DFO59_103473 [Pseudomonas fluorescens]UII17050.1 hypothetical protein LRP86_03967 [Pseudomonas brassicacearum]BBP52231.1 hypothetical protein PHLH3_18570 [Pseudomonas sp. St386]SDP05848.1 hypothetical protein SAMN04490180_0213 [Pseudomonas brassicacearum]
MNGRHNQNKWYHLTLPAFYEELAMHQMSSIPTWTFNHSLCEQNYNNTSSARPPSSWITRWMKCSLVITAAGTTNG